MRKFVKIYSNEHGAWWRPAYCGYTDNKIKAGIFDYDEVVKKYPYIKYDTNDEDYFVDVSPRMIRDEIEDLEYDISILQEKVDNLRNLLAEAEETEE